MKFAGGGLPNNSTQEDSLNFNKSVLLGLGLLVVLFLIGSLLVPGFSTFNNLRSMLLLASFLGLASLGQTLCALLGGIDMSIPFVIGSANILLAGLFNWGIPAAPACLIVVCAGAAVGLLNGILSYRVQGQALIMTLGVGFSIVGATQILTSIGSAYAGNVLGKVPEWMRNVSSIGGNTFGIPVAPVVFIWLVITVVVILVMLRTRIGRQFYAVGGNRQSAARLQISEWFVWVSAYVVSGAVAAMTGALLLGFSGGGYVGVGDPYLFMTIAAVVIGGTSLLGGWGGYGSTVVGVLLLTVLTSLLVGLGLSYAMQQAVFGLLIVPLVAFYARSPHIRHQI
jgi:ribose transport system permease protein